MKVSYSLLKAVTGSCFAALPDGIIPPIKVNITLKITSTIAATTGNVALIAILPVTV